MKIPSASKQNFVIWIDELSAQSSKDFNYCYKAFSLHLDSEEISSHVFRYQGRAYTFHECERRTIQLLDLAEFVPLNRLENCTLKSSDPLEDSALISNDSNLRCIYNGPVEFSLAPRYRIRLRDRRPLLAGYSNHNWFGILRCERRFYFQRKWFLMAFSSDKTYDLSVPTPLLLNPKFVEPNEEPPIIGTLISIGK